MIENQILLYDYFMMIKLFSMLVWKQKSFEKDYNNYGLKKLVGNVMHVCSKLENSLVT